MNEEKVMNLKKQYRKTHHNCRWCVFYTHRWRVREITTEECELKEKILNYPEFSAKFCKWYRTEEDLNNEIQINKRDK